MPPTASTSAVVPTNVPTTPDSGNPTDAQRTTHNAQRTNYKLQGLAPRMSKEKSSALQVASDAVAGHLPQAMGFETEFVVRPKPGTKKPDAEAIAEINPGLRVLSSEEIDAVLKQMHTSEHEMTRQLASNIEELSNFKDKGWERSFKAAQNISFKAMRSITGKHIPSSIRAKDASIAGSAKHQTMRYEYQPFYDAASSLHSYDSDLHQPVEGSLAITSLQNQCVQASIMKVLAENFPNETEGLKKDGALLRSAINERHNAPAELQNLLQTKYASEYPGWMDDIKARATFDEICHLVLPYYNEDVNPDHMKLALEKAKILPNQRIFMPILPADETDFEHSFQMEALAMLTDQMNFNDGDYREVFERTTAQIKTLPDPTERSLIQDALFKKCHQYLDACKKTWKTDHSDQTAINSTFDTIVQIMDGLKFERSSERSPTATPIHPS